MCPIVRNQSYFVSRLQFNSNQKIKKRGEDDDKIVMREKDLTWMGAVGRRRVGSTLDERGVGGVCGAHAIASSVREAINATTHLDFLTNSAQNKRNPVMCGSLPFSIPQ